MINNLLFHLALSKNEKEDIESFVFEEDKGERKRGNFREEIFDNEQPKNLIFDENIFEKI